MTRRVPPRRGGAVLGAVLAAGAGLTACTGSSTADTGTANFPVGNGALTVLAPADRPTPGPLKGATVDGGTLDVAAYKGSVVVLNVWGSWCPPCQAEARDVQAAAQQLTPKGVKVVGIDVREPGGTAAAQAYQRTYGITYPSLFDAGSDSLLALRGTVAANAIPSTVVLDPQGRIAARISGRTTTRTIVDLVDDVLSGKADPKVGS